MGVDYIYILFGAKPSTNLVKFINSYNKAEDISETIDYDDYFINKETFNWMSGDNRKTSLPELEALVNYNDLDVVFFI